MKFRVETNPDRQPVTVWFDTEEQASSACASMNVGAYQRGQGGLYGVYDSEGERVP